MSGMFLTENRAPLFCATAGKVWAPAPGPPTRHPCHPAPGPAPPVCPRASCTPRSRAPCVTHAPPLLQRHPCVPCPRVPRAPRSSATRESPRPQVQRRPPGRIDRSEARARSRTTCAHTPLDRTACVRLFFTLEKKSHVSAKRTDSRPEFKHPQRWRSRAPSRPAGSYSFETLWSSREPSGRVSSPPTEVTANTLPAGASRCRRRERSRPEPAAAAPHAPGGWGWTRSGAGRGVRAQPRFRFRPEGRRRRSASRRRRSERRAGRGRARRPRPRRRPRAQASASRPRLLGRAPAAVPRRGERGSGARAPAVRARSPCRGRRVAACKVNHSRLRGPEVPAPPARRPRCLLRAAGAQGAGPPG